MYSWCGIYVTELEAKQETCIPRRSCYLRPMTDEEYRAKLAWVEANWDNKDVLLAAEFERISQEIHEYERVNFPVPAPTTEEAEAFRGDQEGYQFPTETCRVKLRR